MRRLSLQIPRLAQRLLDQRQLVLEEDTVGPDARGLL
jgi:hypothetical protein